VTEYAWKDRGAATSLELGELAEVLVRAHELELGARPSLAEAELELAQVLLETNRTRSMWRHNWGNVTAGSSWKGDVWRPSWYELTPESTDRDRTLHGDMLAGKAPSAFRGYDTHEQGARDYLRVLGRSPAREAARTGDPVRFATAVRSSYCPDCTESKGFSGAIAKLRDTVRASHVLDSLGLEQPRGAGGGSALPVLLRLAILWAASESAVW